MKRHKPMKPGRGFRRQGPPPRPCKQVSPDWAPRPREWALPRLNVDMSTRLVTPVPKTEPVEHEGYRRLVASLRCIRCMRVGRSQAAHPNTGKGAGIKTDDRECFPLCADGPGYVGCHSLFDQGALYPKEQRRLLEPVWGHLTRQTVTLHLGWPKNLEPWPGDEFLRVDFAILDFQPEEA
jgi:hypothetical protein